MKLYKQYRKPLRLRDYDYSNEGFYYVTICTQNKIAYFGEIIDEKMILNSNGRIAENYWKQIPKRYQNITLDSYIIMPNHIHGIIIIREVDKTGHCPVTTDNKRGGGAKYGLLSKVINSFKGIVTKSIKKTPDGLDFAWQRSFYEHVIRNEEALLKIREYIENNTLQWQLDEYYKE